MAIAGKQIAAAAAANGLAKDSSGNFAVDTTTDAVTFTTAIWTFPTDSLQVTGTPNTGSDAANKDYVDSVAAGLSWKDATLVATTAALPVVTYANGTAGVGATLTATGVGTNTIDGVAISTIGDRLLIKDQVAGLQNGIYEVTTAGTTAVAFVYTRVTDADVSAELDSATAFAQQGTANADKAFVQTANTPAIGTDALVWTEFSAGATLTFKTIATDAGTSPVADTSTDTLTLAGGDGITTTGSSTADSVTFAVIADGDSVSVSATGVKAAVPTALNKTESSAAATAVGDTTGLTIGATPGGDSYVWVEVNGVAYEVGAGVKTADFYYSSDAGTTAKAIAAIATGDTLFLGSGLPFDLATTDLISQHYSVA